MGEFNKESIKYQQNLFLNARKKPLPLIISDKSFIVGVTGFEPATSRPPAERATKLRHTPILLPVFDCADDVSHVQILFYDKEKHLSSIF